MLWDTAGQEEFDCITRAYYRCGPHFSSFRITQFHSTGQNIFPTEQYFCENVESRGAQACVLAFSCVDKESFKQVVGTQYQTDSSA